MRLKLVVPVVNGKVECHQCGLIKELSEFYLFKGKVKRPCKECKLKYRTNFYQENIVKIEVYRQKYYTKNKDVLCHKQSERNKKRKDKIKIYKQQYDQRNKKILQDKKKLYIATREMIDPTFKLRRSISRSINNYLRMCGKSKMGKSIAKHLTYSLIELRRHLENLFEPWMTWNNWGIYSANEWNDNDISTWKWQIDHIIPRRDLPYTSMSDDNFRKCWALENLRPLSAKENNIKGARRI